MEKEFDALRKTVHGCNLCPRMSESSRVLNRSVGPLNSTIMFIGEAPGRLGADGSGIPFHGDKAGHNFEELLTFANIIRSEIFITNAVLCNPKDEQGNNSTPNAIEITNCSTFLKKQLDLVNPKIVVTLGAKALEALNLIQAHNFTLKKDVRSSKSWYDRILIPLYHPGQRAMLHRSFANQRSDYQFIAENVKKFFKKKHNVSGRLTANIKSILEYVLDKKPGISYFALHKLFFLIELTSVKKLGHRLTNAYVVRQKDGPYFTDLHLFKIRKSLPDIQVKTSNGVTYLLGKQKSLFSSQIILEPVIKEIVNEVISKYGNMSNEELKTIVYLSRPMRDILKYEKENLINLYNTPITMYSE